VQLLPVTNILRIWPPRGVGCFIPLGIPTRTESARALQNRLELNGPPPHLLQEHGVHCFTENGFDNLVIVIIINALPLGVIDNGEQLRLRLGSAHAHN
jgi:hypothetical protein